MLSGVLCISDQNHMKHVSRHSFVCAETAVGSAGFHVSRNLDRFHRKQVEREKPNKVDVGQDLETQRVRGMGDVPGRYAQAESQT